MAYRSYDHRLKRLIAESKDPNLFPELNIPRTTALNWIFKGIPDVVTIPELEKSADELILQNKELKKQIKESELKHNLTWFTFRLFGLQIQFQRLKNDEDKKTLVDVIRSAAKVISLRSCLNIIGLTSARFHRWSKSLVACASSIDKKCKRLAPNSLTNQESQKIINLARDEKFFHFSITSLALYAKRHGIAFASPSTWGKVIKEYSIKRFRTRKYPSKNKVGIRACAPGQIWHIDMSIIKLKNLSKVYLQAIIDNFSRYILAYNVTSDFGGANTKQLLFSALERARNLGFKFSPTLISDSGSENVNHAVQSISSHFEDHLIAQVDIDFSNSMVEAFFRKLKNSHLYFKELMSITDAQKQVQFYVEQHNDIIPLAALNGASPLESITQSWTNDNISALNSSHKLAIKNRLAENKSTACGLCV